MRSFMSHEYISGRHSIACLLLPKILTIFFLKLNCKCDVTTQGSFAKKKITLVIIQSLITLKAIVQPNTPTSNNANKKLRTLCHVLNLSYFFIFCNKKIDFQSIHDMEQSGTYNK